jgi:hypothetical protein
MNTLLTRKKKQNKNFVKRKNKIGFFFRINHLYIYYILDLINKKKYTEYQINRNTICVDNRRKKNEIISTY